MSVLLAMDLTQRRASVAIAVGSRTFVRSFSGQATHGDDALFVELDALLAESRVSKSDINTVAVAVGPGSFTGVRVSIATAKCIATALGIQVIAVPSAWIEAEALRKTSSRAETIVALACKKESAWFAPCLYREGRWKFAHEPQVGGVETLISCIDALGAHASGASIALMHDEHLHPSLRDEAIARFVASEALCADGHALLSVARECERAGQVLDPIALVPIYPREPEAVTIWETRTANPHRAN